MSAEPRYRMWVSVDGKPAVPVTATPTVYLPSSGYSSGDYDAPIAGCRLTYKACGLYRADFREVTYARPVPLNHASPVVFDFTNHHGPRLEIVDGYMGVSGE